MASHIYNEVNTFQSSISHIVIGTIFLGPYRLYPFLFFLYLPMICTFLEGRINDSAIKLRIYFYNFTYILRNNT